MLQRLHAPTTTTIKACRSAVIRASHNLDLQILVCCDTPTLDSASTKLTLIKSMLAGLERDLDQVLADRGCCKTCQATADEWTKAEEDHLAQLDRVLAAEREQLGRDDAEPLHSYKVPMHTGTLGDATPHPVACGAPTEDAIHAANWEAL